MGNIKLPILCSGDMIALIAPARAVSVEEMAPFIGWAMAKGLLLQEGTHLYGRHNQFSGSDAERASDFIRAWEDDTVKAIFCARGGYGCMRWLHLLPATMFDTEKQKALVGYSDITTLHLELHSHGYESIHGPMPINWLGNGESTKENIALLEKLLFHGHVSYDLSENRKLNSKPFSGTLIGGNLSLLYASLGTPEQPETQGKILFIEDLDEYLYHIDRMVVSLKRAGILQGLQALLVGEMREMKDNTIPFGMTASEIIEYHCAEYGFPIIFDFPAGHGAKNFGFKLHAYTTFDGNKLIQN